jgi:hypothetical protein
MTIEPTPLGALIAVDFPSDRRQLQPCEYCPGWRFEFLDDEHGRSLLREWHLPDCETAAPPAVDALE